jgi:hypothetical protein
MSFADSVVNFIGSLFIYNLQSLQEFDMVISNKGWRSFFYAAHPLVQDSLWFFEYFIEPIIFGNFGDIDYNAYQEERQ